jgi:hypothetical protein
MTYGVTPMTKASFAAVAVLVGIAAGYGTAGAQVGSLSDPGGFGAAARGSDPWQGRSGYTIQTPGQLPSSVIPVGNGGYSIQPPGRLPTSVTPYGNGGYLVQPPGQLPTYINPR